jgi:hypothetical protein
VRAQDATPFGAIMRRAVEATPGAVGGAFADSQGEMVDGYAAVPDDLAILTAHYGVILGHIHAAFGIWHYGGPEYFIAAHRSFGIVVHAVESGYFALLAVRDPAAPYQSLDSPAPAAVDTGAGSRRRWPTHSKLPRSAWTDRAAAALSTLADAAAALKKEMR